MAKATLQSIPVVPGQEVEIKIDSMAYDNSAIGRYKDFVVMVDRGAPGDLVEAIITTVRPNYARAKIKNIKNSDLSYRIEPKCKIFKVCGGCQWQHLPYEKQLEQKDLLLRGFFKKLDLKDEILKKTIPCDDPWNYRNKVQYPVRTVADTGRLKVGYFEWHSNELVNIKHCPIQHEKFDQIVDTVRELAPKYKITAYDSKDKTGWLRHICVRIGADNKVLLTLVAKDERLSRSQEFVNELMSKHPDLVGVCFNINTKTTNVIYGDKTKIIKGKSYIFEKIEDLKFKVSATSFFQINTPQTIKLLNILKQYAGLNGSETVLDAYSGVGLMSLYLAKSANKVIAIEEIRPSIEDAKESAQSNDIKNISFVNGKVENKISENLEKEKPAVVVLDPPRAGCNKTVLESIINSRSPKIIYISCNPTTLARDLEVLKNGKYEIKSIQPIDMFPHSYHVECVVLLEN